MGICTWHQCHQCDSDSFCSHAELEMEASVNETAKQVEDTPVTPADDAVALPPSSLASCAGSDFTCCKKMCENSCSHDHHGHWCHNTGICTWHQCHQCDSDSFCSHAELEMEASVNETAFV